MVAPLGSNLRARPNTGPGDAAKAPAHGESAPASPSRHSRLAERGSGALSSLKSRASEGGERLKTAVSAGGTRLRAGTTELAKLAGGKLKDEVSKHLTAENIASAVLTAGKIVAKSAPALAAGPAGIPAFGAALMANGGKEIVESAATKAKEKLADPETQQKLVLGGVKMTAQAFAKPAGGTPAGTDQPTTT